MSTASTRGPVRVVDPWSPLARLVTRPAARVAADTELAEAARRLRALGVAALVVGGGGVVTDRELARALADGLAPTEPVAAVATADPVIVPGSTPVAVAAATLLNEDVRHLVVDLGDAEVAVVSIQEVLAVLLQNADRRLWLTSLRFRIDVPSETWLG